MVGEKRSSWTVPPGTLRQVAEFALHLNHPRLPLDRSSKTAFIHDLAFLYPEVWCLQ